MNLYDQVIEKTFKLLDQEKSEIKCVDKKLACTLLGKSPLVLGKDTALELGPPHLDSVTYQMVTTTKSLVDADGIKIIGEDLHRLNKKEVSFGKIILMGVKELDGEDAYEKIKQIEHMKYKMYIEGFMTRVSTEQNKETIRINKKTLEQGISLEKIGNTLITAYKQHPLVEHVQVIFVTKETPLFRALEQLAKEVKEITNAMNTIFDHIEMNCHTCGLKVICEEVEGMRDFHKEQLKK